MTVQTTLPDNKNITDIILDRSLPEFIRSDYPYFEEFMRAYYEWLQLSQQPVDIVNRLREYRDIDRTIADFIEYFRKEYLIGIPENVIADKQLLIKQIKNFYLNKGNENSLKFLFKLLYNENIELYYPKVDILRASDGKWIQTTTMKVLLGSLDINDLGFMFTSTLIGATSGARANVQAINTSTDRNSEILELDLTNYHGTFVKGETLILDPVLSGGPTIVILELYTKIDMITPGTKYTVGDLINVYNTDSNGTELIADGYVKEIGRGPVVSISLNNGGIGYRGLLKDVSDFLYLPLNHDYNGTNLNTQLLSALATEILSHPITATTAADTPDIISIADIPEYIGFGATGYITHVDQVGTILGILLTNGGQDYSNPVSTVISETGQGAIIDTVGGSGAIIATQLNSFPVVLPSDNISIDFTNGTGTGATASIVADGATIKYAGYYKNSDGHLSSDKKLQDNYYYQDFSYVILSSISAAKWQDIIGKIVHPAGTKSFGKINLISIYDNNAAPTLDDDEFTITQVDDRLLALPDISAFYDFTKLPLGAIAEVVDPINGCNLQQATGSRQPIAVDYLGHRCAEFDGTDDYMDALNPALIHIGADSGTVIVVLARGNKSTSMDVTFYARASNSMLLRTRYASSVSNYLRTYATMNDEAIVNAQSPDAIANGVFTFGVGTATRSGSVTMKSRTYSKVSTPGLMDSAFTGTTPGFAVGSSYNTTISSRVDYFKGHIKMIACFRRALTDQEVGYIVEPYLLNKYNV